MKTFGLTCLLGLSAFLTACNSLTDSANDPSGLGRYDRDAVCDNLSRQIGFMQDQGYAVTNQGNTQAQMQQLMATYKANGCDK